MLIEKQFSVRKFENEDLGAVVAVNRLCLPENYAPYFFLDAYRNCPDAFIVAELHGKVVGYIMCRLENGFSELKRFRFAPKGHIISVAVLPDHRDMGVGTSLVQAAIDSFKKLHAEECYLEVRVTNEPAIRLYSRLGFKVTRTIPHYYFDGAEAYVMSLFTAQ